MIQQFADLLVYDIFGMGADSHIGSAIKILILLFLISVIMGMVFGVVTLFIILSGYLFNLM